MNLYNVNFIWKFMILINWECVGKIMMQILFPGATVTPLDIRLQNAWIKLNNTLPCIKIQKKKKH